VTKIHAHSRPYLACGVRLFWDEVRQQPFLLFTEGALVLNKTAWAVLSRCNQQNTVGDIVAELTAQHPSSDVESDVYHLISRIAERGLLKLNHE
jgi:pyrroloquinoline quinone biosynthesis protein D